jgi:hypothetical protein
LFEAQRSRLRTRFSLGAALISQSNTRSLRAHVDKLQMQKAGAFSFNGAGYDIVVFQTCTGA